MKYQQVNNITNCDIKTKKDKKRGRKMSEKQAINAFSALYRIYAEQEKVEIDLKVERTENK